MSNANACPPCSDSPLSVTGNVIGILTFAYVLVVGIWWRVNIVNNAQSELMDLWHEHQQRDKRVKYLGRKAENLSPFNALEPTKVLGYAEDELKKIRTKDEGKILRLTELRGILGSVRNRDKFKTSLEKIKTWTEIAEYLLEEVSDDMPQQPSNAGQKLQEPAGDQTGRRGNQDSASTEPGRTSSERDTHGSVWAPTHNPFPAWKDEESVLAGLS